MKKLFIFLLLMGLSTNLWAWPSETGSGVVSANENIVRASLEATQVLQSDTLANLYGVTILGGTSNYASFNSGGVGDFRNVVSSRDVVRMKSDQFSAWLRTDLVQVHMGLSADNTFVIPDNLKGTGASFSTVAISSTLKVSGNANFINVTVSGAPTITSSYSTGTCSFTFSNGLLKTASC